MGNMNVSKKILNNPFKLTDLQSCLSRPRVSLVSMVKNEERKS